jgi:hypothetical protein
MAFKNSSKAFLDGATVGTADIDNGAVTTVKLAAGAVNASQSLSVANKSGSSIAAGKLVSVSGYDTGLGLAKIVLADQSNAGGLAVWVTTAAIANNASGTVYKATTITGVDTSLASAAGDPVYLGVSGGFTMSAPTASDRQGQIVGAVITKNASTGSVLIDLNSAQDISIGSVQLLAKSVNSVALGDSVLHTANVTVTNAEIKALRATPKTLVAAQGAATVVEFICATILLKAGANVLTESTANLAVKYQNGSGTQISETVETTGFIDQAVDTLTTCRVKQDGIVATSIYTNQPLVLHNLGAGEYGGNAAADATLRVFVAYRVWSTA